MYLIKEYPANTPLKWVMGDGTHPRPALPCPNILQVWFDPRAVHAPLTGWPCVKYELYTTLDSGKRIRGALHFLNKAGPAHVMAFDATIGNKRASVLLYSGSSSNFMSRALQEKLKAL